MVKLKLGISAFVGVIIVILLTIFGWYILPALADSLPVNQLKTIYWIGVVSLWISVAVIVPLNMIIGGRGDYRGAVRGFATFGIGYILSLILYWVLPPTLEALNSITNTADFTTIGWFITYTLWILAMILAPLFMCLKDSIKGGLG